MRIVVLTTLVPFIHGGADYHAQNLVKAIRDLGHEAELVAIPFKWYPPSSIVDHALAARLLDVSESAGVPIDRAIALKFPAWLVRHPDKVMWVIHQHREAYDLWNTELSDLRPAADGAELRRFVRASDQMAFAEARATYANSENVAKRLDKYSGIEAKALYHPPDSAELFHCEEYGRFFFFPSRMTPIKRQELVLEALPHTRQPVAVVFAGAADRPSYAQQLAAKAERLGVENRVRWAGLVTKEEKVRLYATCLGVIFSPLDEDYGYVTLEAMLAAKAVITCTDSGGPLEFVRHGENGLVSEPTPEALAAAMDTLWARADLAASWGKASREIYEAMDIRWTAVVEALLK